MIEINKIYNENNCDTMSRMPDNFIDLTVTSPPYDKLRDYDGYEWNFELVAKELYRVTKNGGVVVWIVNDSTINGSETLTSFKQAIFFRENCGFNLHDTMIYSKAGFASPSSTRYHQTFEYMFILTKGNIATYNLLKDKKNKWESWGKNTRRQKNGDIKEMRKRDPKEDFGQRFNVWYYPIGHGNVTKDELAYTHPAIFPEQLAKDHILSWSNERELVYDPFMGSGTVAKMCILTNRNYVGSEISQKYCELAEKRIMPYKQQLDVFYNAS